MTAAENRDRDVSGNGRRLRPWGTGPNDGRGGRAPPYGKETAGTE